MAPSRKKGKVYLIGVGPGDPELISLKAKRLIELCDCLVYDRSVNPRILSYGLKDAEQIAVGPFADSASQSLSDPEEEINLLLHDLAEKGKMVARLSGGDPFVFGRGSEEALYLREKNIDFEVVPGISSCSAVPAYAGIPLTHRQSSSSFHVFTGHTAANLADIDFQAIVGLEGTLLFLTGMRNLEEIVQKLLSGGKSPETPSALIENGTTSRQRTVTGPLSEILALAEKNDIVSPSVFVVGEVAALHSSLSWFAKGPLFGKRVLVTRSREQAGILSRKIELLGGETLEFPSILILPPDDGAAVDRAIQEIQHYAWLVFTSPNGVDAFFSRLKALKFDLRQLSHLKIAVVGTGTADRLHNYCIFESLMPEVYTTSELAKQLVGQVQKDEKILIARADIGSRELTSHLEQNGFTFTDLTVYKTETPHGSSEELIGLMKVDPPDFITFTSSSTVHGFVKMLGRSQLHLLTKKTKIISIGPVTTKTAREYGIEVFQEARPHTMEGVVDAILSASAPS